ncbi:hypothetical protein M5K25_003561 [Dendrobium thyrsiflorum]|uniref:Uncharacterized protein n=1 Tax=Dendrobium thyrsiflorum TaxID=117978 RepID=A0ABD0VS38_DENTH
MLEEMRRMRERISSGRSTTADEETDSEFPADSSLETVTDNKPQELPVRIPADLAPISEASVANLHLFLKGTVRSTKSDALSFPSLSTSPLLIAEAAIALLAFLCLIPQALHRDFITSTRFQLLIIRSTIKILSYRARPDRVYALAVPFHHLTRSQPLNRNHGRSYGSNAS